MAFTLQVEFVGVCLFVLGDDGTTAVVMPDGRIDAASHKDLQPLEPHVGFLRIPLEHLHGAPALQDPGEFARPFEVLYRFRRQTVHFDLPDEPVKRALEMPYFGEFAPGLEIDQTIFAPRPATRISPEKLAYNSVLMRTRLSGGSLTTPDEPDLCGASSISVWDRGAQPVDLPTSGRAVVTGHAMVGRFYSSAVWEREVAGDTLAMRVTDLDGLNPIDVTLVPRDVGGAAVVSLRMGNLCADNPLAWSEVGNEPAPLEDADFRYLYQLFEAPSDGWLRALNGALLPAPRLVQPGEQLRGRPPFRCGGGTATFSGRIPPTTVWDTAG